jgi:hypothetical protein
MNGVCAGGVVGMPTPRLNLSALRARAPPLKPAALEHARQSKLLALGAH